MVLESISHYVGAMSVFGESPAMIIGLALLGINLTLTFAHVTEEFNGRLWSYFGGIAGVQVPDWLGVPLFTVLLTVVLCSVGLAGITGIVPFWHVASEKWSLGAVSIMISSRLSDGLFSHLLLSKKYFPNPGMKSTPYYFAEAALLTVVFFPGLRNHLLAAAVGFIIGFMAFYVILPFIRLFRNRKPWHPGTPRPDWAQ
jgi:hypothetical protein